MQDGHVQQLEMLKERVGRGELTAKEFCEALEKHGIHGVKKLPYVMNSFGLSLGEAKDIVMSFDQATGWAEELEKTVADLPEKTLQSNIGRRNDSDER